MKISIPTRVKQVVLKWMGATVDPTDRELMGRILGAENARRMNQGAALQLSTVWACVRLISETLATLPMGFYRRKPDGSRVLATNHALYSILHSQPNANMTAVTFWEAVAASMLLWGNAYVEIQRIGGSVVSLNFLFPGRVTVMLVQGLYEYWYNDLTGRRRKLERGNLMHIPAFSLGGELGLSPVQYGAKVLASATGAEDASDAVFQKGLRASGFLTAKQVLQKGQRDDLKAALAKFRGDNDPGGVMVLEADMGYTPMSMNPVDSQLLESRAWSVEELCRWFRVPPFMVGHTQKSTSWGTGIEQQMIGFVTFVLRPWCSRIEQGINKSLLDASESGRYYAEFALEGLLRGDSAARAAFYGIMIDKGILTRDEVRALENWPTMGNNAAVLTVQSATVPLDGISGASDASKAADALKQWLATPSEASQ